MTNAQHGRRQSHVQMLVLKMAKSQPKRGGASTQRSIWRNIWQLFRKQMELRKRERRFAAGGCVPIWVRMLHVNEDYLFNFSITGSTCDVCESTIDMNANPDSFNCESSQTETCSTENEFCMTTFSKLYYDLTITKK